MDELNQQNVKLDPARLTGTSTEKAGLRQLTSIINTDGFGVDDGPSGFAVPPSPSPTLALALTPTPTPTPTPAGSRSRVLPPRLFTTGRLKVGKDFILRHFQYVVMGFADPLYHLQNVFFPGTDKQSAGARKFLQAVGQWGRGVINDQYPMSTERAVFESLVRATGPASFMPSVDWANFGRTDRLWVDALLKRLPQDGTAVGISNVRFENEMQALTEAGWTHFHIICSPETWAKRLRESGMTPQSPVVSDLSEKLAAFLDEDSLRRIRLNPKGPKLRVIWNDPGVQCPSPRFYRLFELTR